MSISSLVSGVGASTREMLVAFVARHQGPLTGMALVVSTGQSSEITEVTLLPFGPVRLPMIRASVSRS
jgi:hypothetical protein